MNTRANRKVQGDARNIEGSHAVVLGGSLAGFLAARILADHCSRSSAVGPHGYSASRIRFA